MEIKMLRRHDLEHRHFLPPRAMIHDRGSLSPLANSACTKCFRQELAFSGDTP